MKCPACGAIDDRVIDSRLGKDNTVIRRRRECLNCKKRFTTYERIEEILPYVIKKDGRREAFDRRKIIEESYNDLFLSETFALEEDVKTNINYTLAGICKEEYEAFGYMVTRHPLHFFKI